MHQALTRIKHQYAWSSREMKEFIISSLFITVAFIIPRIFDNNKPVLEWISLGLLYFLITLVIVYGIIAVMKMVGLAYGYELEYKMSMILLAIGIYLSVLLSGIVSSSIVPWLFVGTFHARTDARMRLGVWRPFRNQGDLSRIVSAGILSAIIALLLFKGLWFASGSDLMRDFVILPWMLAVCMLFPIPGSVGLEMFKKNIPTWVFISCFVIVYGVISLLKQPGAFFTSVVLAAFATWLFSKYASNR